MIKGVCEFYLGMEGRFICKTIVSKFKNMDERELRIHIKKMVLSLAESPNFEKLFQEQGK